MGTLLAGALAAAGHPILACGRAPLAAGRNECLSYVMGLPAPLRILCRLNSGNQQNVPVLQPLGQSLSGYLRDLMDGDAATETNAARACY